MTDVYDWFLKERGIRAETLDAFGVKIKGQDVVFRYETGEKTRRVYDDGRREFFFTKGRVPSLYHPFTVKGGSVAFLCEGETDTMRLWQEMRAAGKDEVAVFGLAGVNTWQESFASILKLYDRVYVILDNDTDYKAAGQVEEVWKRIRNALGLDRVRRIRLPDKTNDLCEFFGTYDLEILSKLAKRHSGSRFKPLNLSKPPPPPKWLVEGMFAKGDVTLVHGREGNGKSWLTQALAIAVVERHEYFLGEKVNFHGKVLYVDQENPDDDVYRRLYALGAGEATRRGDLRYLWDQAIRLDRNPDDLLEEALDFEPEAIILDALARIHTQDENSAGQMAALFEDGIKPLARETGAAVILIHHDNKGDDFRGSVDIAASPDNVFQIRSAGTAKFQLIQGKTRRRKRGEDHVIEIVDQPDGSVRLDARAVIDPPF